MSLNELIYNVSLTTHEKSDLDQTTLSPYKTEQSKLSPHTYSKLRGILKSERSEDLKGAGLYQLWSDRTSSEEVELASNLIIQTSMRLRQPAAKSREIFIAVNECADHLIDAVPTLKRGYLARVAESMGELFVKNEGFLNSVSNRLINSNFEIKGHHAVRILAGYGNLNYSAPNLVDNLLERLHGIGNYSSRDLAMCFRLVSALAVIGSDQQLASGVELIDKVIRQDGHGRLRVSDYKSLYQALYSRDMLESTTTLGVFLTNCMRVLKPHRPEPSAFARQIANSLQAMGYQTEMEAPISGYNADIVFNAGGRKTVVECDWSAIHYVNGDPSVGLRGPDVIRDRVYSRSGYHVARVVTEDWRMATDRTELLQRILELN